MYSDFFQEVMTVIDNITPCKTERIKGDTQNWFDGEVLQKLSLREKIFKKIERTRLHNDKELNKKTKYYPLKFIPAKKQAVFDKVLVNQKNVKHLEIS